MSDMINRLMREAGIDRWQAILALNAMQQPTDDMIARGNRCKRCGGNPTDIYRAMISTELQETRWKRPEKSTTSVA